MTRSLARGGPNRRFVKVTLSVSERFRGTAEDTLVVRTEVGTEAWGIRSKSVMNTWFLRMKTRGT